MLRPNCKIARMPLVHQLTCFALNDKLFRSTIRAPLHCVDPRCASTARTSMTVPYFLRNLVPRKENTVKSRTLLEVLATITWVQWAQYFVG